VQCEFITLKFFYNKSTVEYKLCNSTSLRILSNNQCRGTATNSQYLVRGRCS